MQSHSTLHWKSISAVNVSPLNQWTTMPDLFINTMLILNIQLMSNCFFTWPNPNASPAARLLFCPFCSVFVVLFDVKTSHIEMLLFLLLHTCCVYGMNHMNFCFCLKWILLRCIYRFLMSSVCHRRRRRHCRYEMVLRTFHAAILRIQGKINLMMYTFALASCFVLHFCAAYFIVKDFRSCGFMMWVNDSNLCVHKIELKATRTLWWN